MVCITQQNENVGNGENSTMRSIRDDTVYYGQIHGQRHTLFNTHNKVSIENSDTVACLFCGAIVNASRICQYLYDDTAVCPICSVDAMVGDHDMSNIEELRVISISLFGEVSGHSDIVFERHDADFYDTAEQNFGFEFVQNEIYTILEYENWQHDIIRQALYDGDGSCEFEYIHTGNNTLICTHHINLVTCDIHEESTGLHYALVKKSNQTCATVVNAYGTMMVFTSYDEEIVRPCMGIHGVGFIRLSSSQNTEIPCELNYWTISNNG